MFLEKVVFNDIDHFLHLTENKDAMLGEGATGIRNAIDRIEFSCVGSRRAAPNATVCKQLPEYNFSLGS